MEASLREWLGKIESLRCEISDAVSTLTAEQSRWKPSPDAWSAGQIVEHLTLADAKLGAPSREAGLEREGALLRVVPRSTRFAMALRAFSRNVTLPLPSPDLDPTGVPSIAESLLDWERVHRQIAVALDTVDAGEPSYFHPILGPLSAAQMLELCHAHMAYHGRQIQDRVKAIPA